MTTYKQNHWDLCRDWVVGEAGRKQGDQLESLFGHWKGYGDAWAPETQDIANSGWVGFIRVELFTDAVISSVSTREIAFTFQYFSLKHEQAATELQVLKKMSSNETPSSKVIREPR